MLTRLKHTSQGIVIGALIAISILGYSYYRTHTIKYYVSASNEPNGVIAATSAATSVSAMMNGANEEQKKNIKKTVAQQ